MKSVPVNHKKTASKIIEFLKQNEISWNQHKEVKLNNKVIPDSNIVELINFLLRNRIKKPDAFEDFKEKLIIHDFPQDFIKNKYLIFKKNHSPIVKAMFAKPKTRKFSVNSKWIKL